MGFGKTVRKSEYEAIIRDMEGQSGEMRQGRVSIRGKEVKKRDVKRYLTRKTKKGSSIGDCGPNGTEKIVDKALDRGRGT